MLIPHLRQQLFIAILVLLFISPATQAQVYKWVDASGKTHYSDKPEDAARAKAAQLKTSPPPAARQVQTSPAQTLEAQELEFRKRRIERENERLRANQPAPPKSLSGGKLPDNSDASICNLARDILNGTVHRTNGLPIDANDREVAAREVREHCK